MATEDTAPFVPAYADHYCVNCGFPFRGGDLHGPYCRTHFDPIPNACETRRQNAETASGLRERLSRTQKANPYTRHTSPYAIAHGWVRQHYPHEDLRKWLPSETAQLHRGDEVPDRPGGSRTAQSLPAEACETATDMLRRLLGVDLWTLSDRRRNVILSVSPPTVLVRTDSSSDGQPVPIADLEHALTLLRRDGSVTIHPHVIGYRSSFLGAVLHTLPGSTVTGSPPRLTVATGEGTDQATSDSDGEVTFEGDLGRGRTVEERREQRSLRRLLFGGRETEQCALCGEVYPVRFLWAAHVKKRSLCTDSERRDLSRVAMAACVFGCDALFEMGFISVSEDGAIISAVGMGGAVGRRVEELRGRRCHAHSALSEPYFRWHRGNVFRG